MFGQRTDRPGDKAQERTALKHSTCVLSDRGQRSVSGNNILPIRWVSPCQSVLFYKPAPHMFSTLHPHTSPDEGAESNFH